MDDEEIPDRPTEREIGTDPMAKDVESQTLPAPKKEVEIQTVEEEKRVVKAAASQVSSKRVSAQKRTKKEARQEPEVRIDDETFGKEMDGQNDDDDHEHSREELPEHEEPEVKSNLE